MSLSKVKDLVIYNTYAKLENIVDRYPDGKVNVTMEKGDERFYEVKRDSQGDVRIVTSGGRQSIQLDLNGQRSGSGSNSDDLNMPNGSHNSENTIRYHASSANRDTIVDFDKDKITKKTMIDNDGIDGHGKTCVYPYVPDER